MLNPKKIDYTKIPAHIAWELNLPLPPYYKFLYFGSHATGNTGLENLIQRCGGLSYYQGDGYEGDRAKQSYITLFCQIMQSRDLGDYFSYIALRNYIPQNKQESGAKLCALIPPTPSVYLVRDPISALKSACALNPNYEKYKEMQKLCTAESLIAFLQDKESVKFTETKDFTRLMEYFIRDIYYLFHDTQLWDFLIHFKECITLDMSEIVGDKAYETMNYLAKELDFPPPNPKDKAMFAMGISEYYTLLPTALKFKSHNQVITITLMDKVFCMDKRIYFGNPSNPHKQALENYFNYKDITSFLFNQTCFDDRIIVCISAEDYAILLQDEKLLNTMKAQLLEIIPLIEQQKEIQSAKKLTEKDILEYFKTHKNICLEAKEVFAKHLAFLKSVRPDIIESWKYYKEFLAICEEMS